MATNPQAGGTFNIANIFRRAPPSDARTGAAVAGQPGAPVARTTTVPGTGGMPKDMAPNPGADPANQDLGTGDLTAGGNGEPNSPLDNFKDIFTIDPDKQTPKNPLDEQLFSVDSKKMTDAIGKMNFSGAVPKELIAKALGGDADAFYRALNMVSQSTMQVSTQMVTSLVEAAMKKNNQRFESVLGDRIRTNMLRFQRPENPALNHPAAQPVLAAIRETIANQNPQLGPEDISKKAEEYFTAMADSLVAGRKKPEDLESTGTGEVDWSEFLK